MTETGEGRCAVTDTSVYAVRVGVFAVMKANMNDEMLITEETIPIDRLKDQPLWWFDPFFGRGVGRELAICEITSDTVAYELRRDGITERFTESGTVYLSENGNEYSFLAVHLQVLRTPGAISGRNG